MIRINASTIAKVVKNNVNKLKRGKFHEEDAWSLLKKISYLSSRIQAVLEYSAMAKFNTKEEFIEDNLFDFIEEYCENVYEGLLQAEKEGLVKIYRYPNKPACFKQDCSDILDKWRYYKNKLNKEKEVTVLLITHYMEEVVDADYVYVMENGKIIMDGTPREIFSRALQFENA